MGYGRLTPDQIATVKLYGADRVVHDLGAGDLEGSLNLLRCGAHRVVAIDKEALYTPQDISPFVLERHRLLFRDYKDPIDVAYVSWPINRQDDGLRALLSRARLIIYLGKNTDGSACAWPGFFLDMSMRELLAYVPDRKNTLVVYGDKLAEPRKLRGEEIAGATTFLGNGIMSYEDVEQEDKQ